MKISALILTFFGLLTAVPAQAEIFLSGTPQEFRAQSKEIKAAAKQVLNDIVSGTLKKSIPVQIVYASREDEIVENSYRIISETVKNCRGSEFSSLGWAADEHEQVQRAVIFRYARCENLPNANHRSIWVQLDSELRPIGLLVTENALSVVAPSAEKE